jgi:phosphatidate cytidylyltransferase
LNPALDTAPDPQPKKGPSNLRLRAIWGALAAALLFGCTFGGPISFGLFFAAVQAVMLKEFYRIMRAAGYQPAAAAGIVASLAIFGITAYGFQTYYPIAATVNGSILINGMVNPAVQLQNWTLLAISTIGMVMLQTLFIIMREIIAWPKFKAPFVNISVSIGGLFYISLPMTLLIFIAYGSGHFDPRRVFFLIFLIWAADTGAYFAGKNLGKHKLAPSISPGKTWEGWAGGALLTLAVGWAAGYFLPDIPLSHRLVAAGVVAVFGPLGDLAESMLKRSAGVKDSGTFLPGHGGLLDRFDAFLLVLPVLALLQVLAG